MAPSPAFRSFRVSLSCRQAVISEARPGRAAEIHSSRPRSSVRAIASRPWHLFSRGKVLPILLPGSAPGADHRSVQQYDVAALSGDLLQGPVQAWGADGEQADDLLHPSGHGGAVDAVAAGQVARPLVTAQHCQHDGGDLPRGQDATASRSCRGSRVSGRRASSGWHSTAAGGRCRQGRQGPRGTDVFLHTKRGPVSKDRAPRDYGRAVNRTSPRLCRQSRSASLVIFARRGSSLPRTEVSRPSRSPTP